jgi:hypothetical protein
MQVISRREQDEKVGQGYGPSSQLRRRMPLSDDIFDGRSTPRQIAAHNWLTEGEVHKEKILSFGVDSDRYLLGPHVTITRDDMRRVTWAAIVEEGTLVLSRYEGPLVERNKGIRVDRRFLGGESVWRYSLALDKFKGEPSVVWVQGAKDARTLWLDGQPIQTRASDVDFPFLAFSQLPVGHVQTKPAEYAILGYKDRKTGKTYLRRIQNASMDEEIEVEAEQTLGGISIAVSDEKVVARVDLLVDGRISPALIMSTDGGRTYSPPKAVDLNAFTGEFETLPGYARPIVDKGGDFHVPIGLTSQSEALSLNYVVREDALVEAIRVPGVGRETDLEVFPSTVGGRDSFGNGVSDGHGLIMVMSTADGRLFSSNSSAGGIYFPPSVMLNHEMPLVAAFSASECYSSGLKPNMVSMDYLFIEANDRGEAVTPRVHIETWDMPLPFPKAVARAEGSRVYLDVQADCDLEPGKVRVAFDDPAVVVTKLEVPDLRSAVIETNTSDMKGKVLAYDVLTLFHRHHGEAIIG